MNRVAWAHAEFTLYNDSGSMLVHVSRAALLQPHPPEPRPFWPRHVRFAYDCTPWDCCEGTQIRHGFLPSPKAAHPVAFN